MRKMHNKELNKSCNMQDYGKINFSPETHKNVGKTYSPLLKTEFGDLTFVDWYKKVRKKYETNT